MVGSDAVGSDSTLNGPNVGPGANDDYANGIIDEVRIENVARSSEWIAAKYTSESDALVTNAPVDR